MPADLKLTAYTYDDTIGPMWWIEISDVEPWPTREEAEAAIARYHAAVVESSPEVARLRARVAELTLERDGLSEMVEELEAVVLDQGRADYLAMFDAAARADERARTERDIADFARCAGDDNLADHIEKSDYPRLQR